ncbi:hypothetical protein V8E36_003742 [Tilletia maclaganii]
MSDDRTQDEQAQRATQERQAHQDMLERQAQQDAEVAAAAATAVAPRTRSRTGATGVATGSGGPATASAAAQSSPAARTNSKKAGKTAVEVLEAVSGQDPGREQAGSSGASRTAGTSGLVAGASTTGGTSTSPIGTGQAAEAWGRTGGRVRQGRLLVRGPNVGSGSLRSGLKHASGMEQTSRAKGKGKRTRVEDDGGVDDATRTPQRRRVDTTHRPHMAAQSSSDAEEAGSQEPLDHPQRRQQTLDALLDLSPDSVQKVLAAVKRNAHIPAEAEDVDVALFPATGTSKHADGLKLARTTAGRLPITSGSHRAGSIDSGTEHQRTVGHLPNCFSWMGTATGTGFGGHSQTGHLQRAVTTSALPPLAFQSGRQWSASVSLPHSSVLGNVASSTYVPLWHFTPEGIRAGYEKGMTTTKTGRALIEQLGAQVELADVKVADGRMSFHQFFAAADTWVAAIRHCAVTAQDPVAASMLSQEAEGWGTAMQNLLSAPEAKTPEVWKFQARYAEMLRREFYAFPPGELRLDPSKHQHEIWEQVKRNVQVFGFGDSGGGGSGAGTSQHRGQKGTSGGGGGTYAKRFEHNTTTSQAAKAHHADGPHRTPRDSDQLGDSCASRTGRPSASGSIAKDVSANHATTTSAPCAATTPTAPNLAASSSMRRQTQQEDGSQALRVPAEARRLKPDAFAKALDWWRVFATVSPSVFHPSPKREHQRTTARRGKMWQACGKWRGRRWRKEDGEDFSHRRRWRSGWGLSNQARWRAMRLFETHHVA